MSGTGGLGLRLKTAPLTMTINQVPFFIFQPE